jgi:hypothetical protein
LTPTLGVRWRVDHHLLHQAPQRHDQFGGLGAAYCSIAAGCSVTTSAAATRSGDPAMPLQTP